MIEQNLLIDASNVLWKAHWGCKMMAQSKDVDPTYADAYMFMTMIRSYKKMYPESTMWMVWDKKLDYHISNPRKEDQKEYKGNRDKDAAKDVFANGQIIEKLCDNLGVKNFYPSHLEADDCIAWLTTKLKNCIIFSSDQDFPQLVSENVSIYNIQKKKLIDIYNFDLVYGLTPEQYLIYKCALGDPADNIKGIDGFGKMRSKRIATQWPNVKPGNFKDIIEENLKVMDLSNNAYVDELELSRYNEQYEKLTTETLFDIDSFVSILESLNIKKLVDTQAVKQWKQLFQEEKPNTMSGVEKMLRDLNVVR